MGNDPVNKTDPTGMFVCCVIVRQERYQYHAYTRFIDTNTPRETIARGGPNEDRGLGAIIGSPQGSVAGSGMASDLVFGSPNNTITVEVTDAELSRDTRVMRENGWEPHILGEVTLDADYDDVVRDAQRLGEQIEGAGINYSIFGDNSNGVATTMWEERTQTPAPETGNPLTLGYGRNYCQTGQVACNK